MWLLVGSVAVTFIAAIVAIVGVIPALWIVVLLGLAGFWFAIWQLVLDTARRVRNAVRDFSMEFRAAVGEQRRPEPLDLGELKSLDE